MANRKSWRRAVGSPAAHRPPPPKSHSSVSDPALTTLLTALLAKQVTVSTLPGPSYTGLFAGTETTSKGDLQVALRYARASATLSSGPALCTDIRGGMAASVLVPIAAIIAVEGAGGVFEAAATAERFATDAEISKGNGGVGRQLKRFDDFTELSSAAGRGAATLDEQTFGELAGANGGRAKKWDQFQVNEDKFGVTTSFDENEYTTKIDRGDANYEDKMREAERLAAEIEAKGSENIHLREERNQEVSDDVDEEARFSGVQRSSAQEPRGKSAVADPVKEKESAPAPAAPSARPKLSYAAAAAGAVKASAQPNAPPAASGNVASAANAVKGVPTKAPSSKTPQAKATAGKGHGQKNTVAKTPSAKSASTKSMTGKVQPAKTAPTRTTGAKSAQSRHAPFKNGGGSKAVPGKAVSSASSVVPSVPMSSGKHAQNKSHATKQTSTTTPSITTSGTESKEKEVFEKNAKQGGPREPSSLDNLPQLVKVRSQITGRTSPNQSRNSPLPTPAAPDTSAVAVLNLDAQTPNLGPEQIKSFEEYKTNREIQSIAENRERITDDLKKFSTSLESRNGPLRRANSNLSSSTNGTSGTSSAEKKTVEVVLKGDGKIEEAKSNEASVSKPVEVTPSAADSSKGSEVPPLQKPKLKSKLNPNAQEFKLNPDAPSFEPSVRKQVPQIQHPPPSFSPYVMRGVQPDYSQAMQAGHQGYPVPMQAMGQIPYGQPYGMVMQGPVPGGMVNGNPAYQFMQGPPGSFPAPQQVPGRFPQSASMAVSYGYPPMNPTLPMVMAQAPQRLPPGAYGYYNSGPYAAGQVPGVAPMTQPSQHQHYPPGATQGGVPHLHAVSIPGGGRGGHGFVRRGNGGRRGGKHQGQQTHPAQQNGAVGQMDKTPPRSGESNSSTNIGQR